MASTYSATCFSARLTSNSRLFYMNAAGTISELKYSRQRRLSGPLASLERSIRELYALFTKRRVADRADDIALNVMEAAMGTAANWTAHANAGNAAFS